MDKVDNQIQTQEFAEHYKKGSSPPNAILVNETSNGGRGYNNRITLNRVTRVLLIQETRGNQNPAAIYDAMEQLNGGTCNIFSYDKCEQVI